MNMSDNNKPSMSPESTGTAEDEATSMENPGTEKVSSNPDPRANENLADKDKHAGNTEEVGSEITDGEAG
jgi:hypothetical protein